MTNFLLARGERLTHDVVVRGGGGPKVAPYTFTEAKQRLAPMLQHASTALDHLPDAACPRDQAVASLILNPEYIAKSHFPAGLLRSVGLEAVGSRPKRITPEKRSKGREVEEAVTTELFLAGTRSAFRRWSEGIAGWTTDHDGADQLVSIEQIAAPEPQDKLIHIEDVGRKAVFEVVLHAEEEYGETFVVPRFKQYLKTLGIDAPLAKRFYAGGLGFVELEAPRSKVRDVAAFSLVRAVRPMPPLRMLRPSIRTAGIGTDTVTLPAAGPLDPKIQAAIFDGGLPPKHALTKWAKPIDAPGVGAADAALLKHGIGVTSAFLFGHINPALPVPRPFAGVHHYRVLDTEPGQDPFELYEVLGRLESVLNSKHYDFVNLSFGPELPVDDNEVHAWTAVLDEYLSHGKSLTVVAVGNGGQRDVATAANRIQVPADCVNALAIGSADSPDTPCPGLIKPDLVSFGGSVARPYLVVGEKDASKLEPTGGTSFAAPGTLRMAAGVRAHLGTSLSPLAIRALLVHCAEPSDIPHVEVGWGRVAQDLADIAVCPDDTVRVVYEGTITASKYVRAPIPVPAEPLEGLVKIKATLCYATEVDPHHPGNYTRAGLDATFRPNRTKVAEKAQHAASKSFFGKNRPTVTEEELRRDAWKWENCLHAENSYRGRSLNAPAFDIHYNARAEGKDNSKKQELRYALIISVHARRTSDLYNRIVRRYQGTLEALLPVIEIPVTLRPE
jgi:Subtilase family